MSKFDDLAAKLVALRSEIDELAAIDEPTDEQSARMEAVLPEWDETKAEYDRMEAYNAKVEAVRAAHIEPSNREAAVPAVHIKRGAEDVFANLDHVQRGEVRGAELRERAMRAVDVTASRGMPAAHRERAEYLIETNEGAARLALLTGSPAYRSAFEKVLQYPESYQGMLTGAEAEALRTAMSTTSGNGGYAIPFLLDSTVVIANTGSTNPIRGAARVVNGTSNKWQGLTSAGVTSYWKGEGSAFTDGSPTLSQPSITAHLGSAYVLGSYEVFEDTNLAAQLPELVADAKDRLEADAFAVGSGSTAPYGVVTATTAVTTSRVTPTTGGTFTSASSADVWKVLNALQPRYRSQSKWLANFATINIIRQMTPANYAGGEWADFGGGTPPELLGLQVLESSAVVSTVTTGSNILLCGDFSKYLIYDRLGTTIEYIPNVVDGSGIPTGQRGWVAHWRTGADAIVPDAFRVLKL